MEQDHYKLSAVSQEERREKQKVSGMLRKLQSNSKMSKPRACGRAEFRVCSEEAVRAEKEMLGPARMHDLPAGSQVEGRWQVLLPESQLQEWHAQGGLSL